MGGIVSDVQTLFEQQVRLTRAEITTDLRKFREAGALFAPGAGVLVVSLVVLALMLAHLLHALTSPAGTDPASLPLWVCYAIVGVVLAIVGGALVFLGMKKLDSVNPLAGPTAQALEEDIQWMSKPK
jgi:uncharacterized membrane protein